MVDTRRKPMQAPDENCNRLSNAEPVPALLLCRLAPLISWRLRDLVHLIEGVSGIAGHERFRSAAADAAKEIDLDGRSGEKSPVQRRVVEP
jgi:hypothetical protein